MRKLIISIALILSAAVVAATYGSLDTDAGAYAADFKINFSGRPSQVSVYASGGTVTYSGWKALSDTNWVRVVPRDTAGDTVVTVFDGGVVNESSVGVDVLVVHRGTARAVIYWQ